MKNIIITDAKYRTSLAIIHSLAGEKYNIIVCQTDDYKKTPLSFKSKYIKRAVFLREDNYKNDLLELIKESDFPVVLPVGAKTVELLSREQEEFSKYCSFIVSSPDVLEKSNDKKAVMRVARDLDIPTPKDYVAQPDSYPVIVKPFCGEKFGLHAEERYIKANNARQYHKAITEMSRYDSSPIVQEYVEGASVGVCVIMDRNSEAVGYICHKRIREYPIAGGPSTCCKTIYEPELVEKSILLLKEINFRGIAMVEYKGGKLLEINPRVWGSFPLTEKSKSNFTKNWVNCISGMECEDNFYKSNVKMHFVVNDSLSVFKHLLCGHFSQFFRGISDFFNPFVKEALFSFDDPVPFFVYLRNLFFQRFL